MPNEEKNPQLSDVDESQLEPLQTEISNDVTESGQLPKVDELPEKEGMDDINEEITAGEGGLDDINIDQAVGEISEMVKPTGIEFPEIDPVIFDLGPLAIRWYSLAYLFGILLGWFYIQYLNKHKAEHKMTHSQMDAIPLWMVLSIILGGRIGYVLFYNFEYYLNNLSEIGKVWQGGMSFHGGLIGVIVGMYIYSAIYKVKYLRIMDLLAAATPIGLFLGRIANFINAELWGRRTSWEYGVIFPNDNFARHPSQLYEATLEGLLLFIILAFAVKFGALKRVGLLSGLFLIFYGAFRFFVEFFREPDIQLGFLLGTEWLTMGMILCIPMVLLGIFLSVKAKSD